MNHTHLCESNADEFCSRFLSINGWIRAYLAGESEEGGEISLFELWEDPEKERVFYSFWDAWRILMDRSREARMQKKLFGDEDGNVFVEENDYLENEIEVEIEV